MKTENAKQEANGNDTFIREIRATYHMTGTRPFAITGPDDVAAFVRSVLSDNSREHFIALYLDGAHQVVSYSTIGIGTANSCSAHPREIYQRAILAGAVAIIVAHNHPSGNVEPSKEDIALTKRLGNAGAILGIPLLDHLIVSDLTHQSIVNI